MKLYCVCGNCRQRINLQYKAATRQLLSKQIGFNFNITCSNCRITSQGNVKIIYAESSYKYAPISTTVAAAGVGAFFGPIGLIIGIIGGAGSGASIKYSDKLEVNTFNNS